MEASLSGALASFRSAPAELEWRARADGARASMELGAHAAPTADGPAADGRIVRVVTRGRRVACLSERGLEIMAAGPRLTLVARGRCNAAR